MKLSDWLFAPGGKALGGIVLGVLLDDGAIFFFGCGGGARGALRKYKRLEVFAFFYYLF
jgi:hypothetical protein